MAKPRQIVKKARGVTVQIFGKDDYLIHGPTHIEVDGEKTLVALEMLLQVCGINEQDANCIKETIAEDEEKQDVLITITIKQGGKYFVVEDWEDTREKKEND